MMGGRARPDAAGRDRVTQPANRGRCKCTPQEAPTATASCSTRCAYAWFGPRLRAYTAVLHRVLDLPRVLALPCLRACITLCLSVFAWRLSIFLQFSVSPRTHSTRAHAFTRPRQGRYKRGDVCLLKSPSHPDQVIVKRLVGSCLRACVLCMYANAYMQSRTRLTFSSVY